MPPKKKGKGKKTKKQENRIDTLTEVDKTFYELQITDLNRKLARLKQTSQELEDQNYQLENRLENLDEDRADVISYLKRMVSTKQNESLELQERVTALQETKDSEGKEYEDKIEELETENKTMKDQLTSEIKLLIGKLNSLEEFRMQRDELMAKFEEQEQKIQDQEIKEKKTLYEIEKKFIISKKNIASEMEKQLFNLANNFEKANEVRIAATTQRCIRENIVLNNELNKMIFTLENFSQQVEQYKTKNIELRLNCDLYQAERNKTINELQVVRAHLDQLTKDFHSRVKILRSYEVLMKKSQKAHEEMKHAKAMETALAAKVRILEQNLHSTRSKEIDLKQLVLKQNTLVKYFHEINREAVTAIEDCLKITLNPRLDEAGKQYRRNLLLQNLLSILTQPQVDTHTILSMETIDSISSKYQRGDLGFLPKEVQYKKENLQVLNAAVQVTPRYDDAAYMLSPMHSKKSNASIDSQSCYTQLSNQFQACSMLDIPNNYRTLGSSIIFAGKYISESQIANMLSDQSCQSDLTQTSSELSKEVTSKSESDVDKDEKEISMIEIEIASIEKELARIDSIDKEIVIKDKEEITPGQGEEVIKNIDNVKEQEEKMEAEIIEEIPEESDEENTVFGNTTDEAELSNVSSND